MGQVVITNTNDLRVETEKFKGKSIPAIDGEEYILISLDGYEGHIKQVATGAAGEKTEIDAGKVARFDGITIEMPEPTTAGAEPSEILYSTARGAFCFRVGSKLCAYHSRLNEVYNELPTFNTVRKDKMFLYAGALYAFDDVQGSLVKLNGVTITQKLGTSVEKVPSERAVNDAISAEAAKTAEIDRKVTAERTERVDADAALQAGLDAVNNRVTEEGKKAAAATSTVSTDVASLNKRTSNVDNTRDADKPISSATLQKFNETDLAIRRGDEKVSAEVTKVSQKADGINDRVTAEVSRAAGERSRIEQKVNNLDGRTSNVDNTRDVDKPVSTLQRQAINTVDTKVTRIETDYKAADAALQQTVDGMKAAVEQLILGASDHIAAAWDGTTNERAVSEIGDKNLIDFKLFLIDHKDNAGEFTAPVGVLQRNNILRFEDGRFAPVVGITPEMKAQTDGDVYRKSGGSLVKYCGPGEFNAEKFLKQYGIAEKTFDAKGNEIHTLRPWETSSTDYSVMLGYEGKLYMIDNAEGTGGKIWKEISTQPHSWDGINPVELAPTAINPSGVYCIEDNGTIKTRCFFNLYEGLDKGYVHSAGHAGAGSLCTMFAGGRTYPTTGGIQQVKNMEWARNNNADPTKCVPFAEGGFAYRNMFIAYLEMKYGRKDLHNENFFGSGISSNTSISTYEGWLEHGGVRYKVGDGTTWSYAYWAATAPVCYNAAGKTANWSDLVNGYYAKEQCMESQLAASWAVENSIREGEHFEMYGGEYWYENVPGTLGLADGRMNVRIYKLVKGEFNAFTKAGASTKVTVECILRMSVYDGMKLAGDVYQYVGGGYEVVGETLESSAGGGTYGEPVDVYLQPDQKKWLRETSSTKSEKGHFDFEKSYMYLGKSETKGGYALRTMPFSNFPLQVGGGLTKGDCYYFYNSNWWGYSTPGNRVRIAQRFGGYAANGFCAPRYAYCYYNVLSAYAHFGGSAQVLIKPEIA